MYKKASSELVVARRRGGADDRAEDMCVAAADRVQGPLVEDDGDDAIHIVAAEANFGRESFRRSQPGL